MLVVAEFEIKGLARFLSHAETLRLFCRALRRAGLKMRFSQGFNPHPRLSLPLPRSVGVEADADLLCVELAEQTACAGAKSEAEPLKADINAQLPQDVRLRRVNLEKDGALPVPRRVTYVLQPAGPPSGLKQRVTRLMRSDALPVSRPARPGHGARTVDVRRFIESVEIRARRVLVRCLVEPCGTIRPGEILALLGLEAGDLAGPIRRTDIEWRKQ